jgi:hypothetical protein
MGVGVGCDSTVLRIAKKCGANEINVVMPIFVTIASMSALFFAKISSRVGFMSQTFAVAGASEAAGASRTAGVGVAGSAIAVSIRALIASTASPD